MRVTRRFLRFGTAALTALVANAPAISAQTPPGPGWEGRTCPRTLTNRVVRANAGANFDEFFWTIGTLQLQRYVGATNHAQYAVFPSNTAQRSSPNGNKTADWTGGQVDFYCWEKHTLLNNVPTTDYLYKQGAFVAGSFTVNGEYMCDENGNIVLYGGTPCEDGGDPGDPPLGGGEGGSPTNCYQEWIYLDVDYGNGWVNIWQGYATVCDG